MGYHNHLYTTLRSRSRTLIFLLKFYVKVFAISLFPSPSKDLVHVLYDDRYWSKVLRGTISTPHMTLRSRSQNVYVEILCQNF